MNQLTQVNLESGLHTDLIKQASVASSALDQLFAAEESKVAKARHVLGEAVTHTNDEELEVYLTELQYLIDCWLDQFERETFGGQTLRQLLQGQ